MAFSVHTFETHPEGNLGYGFHKNIGEGQEVYFLAKFPRGTENSSEIADDLFGTLLSGIKESKLLDSYDKFEEAVKKVNQTSTQYLPQFPAHPEIVLAYFDFHHLYLTQCGEAEAYLLRDNSVSQITEIPEKHSDLFQNILSGQVSLDDVVILSSHRVLRTITTQELTQIFNNPNFSNATQDFKHQLAQKSEDELLVTLIGIGKKDEVISAGFLSKIIPNVLPESKKQEEVPETSKYQSTLLPEEDYQAEDTYEKIEENASSNNISPSSDNNTQNKSSYARTQKAPMNLADKIPSMPKVDMSAIKNFRPQKNLLILAGVIFLLFLVGIGMKSVNWESDEEIRLREELNIAREALQQADTFLVQGDRVEAKTFLEKANSSVQEVFKSKSKSFRSDAQFLLADIKSKQLQVENSRQVTPNLVSDLSVKIDETAVGLIGLNGSNYAYTSKKVIKTIRNIVETPLTVSDSSGSIVAASVRPDQKMILFLTSDPRIVEYREGVLTPMQTADEHWKKGVDLKTYGRFTYVLNPSENQIWKYERRRSNYSNSTAYSQGANLAQAVSFTIDGSIYIISADGNIQKIFRGEEQNYEFRDLPSVALEGPNLKIYTSADLDYLYVLDPDNSRMLMFTKGDRFATYKRQILFGVENAKDFYVDDSGQKVTLTTNDKIFEFPL